MAWIESNQSVKDHPKTLKLSAIMEWDLDVTIGKLHRLWWWCLDYAIDGNVSRHSADIVAQCVGLAPQDGEKLIKALHEAGFLDQTKHKQFLIHDWLEYAGRYLRDTKFRRNPEKIQEIIQLHSTIVSRQSADKIRKRGTMSAVPYLTNLTDITLPKEYIEICKVLVNIPGYPFDKDKDIPILKEKESDFPDVDILALVKGWKIYLTDNPLKPNSNVRSQLNNQFEFAKKYNKYQKGGGNNGSHKQRTGSNNQQSHSEYDRIGKVSGSED